MLFHWNIHFFHLIQDGIIPGEVRRELSSPLSTLQHMNLKFITTRTCPSFANVVDSALWTAPHTKMISVIGRFYVLSAEVLDTLHSHHLKYDQSCVMHLSTFQMSW